ncbi:CRISPR-associated protein Cas7 [uncultured Bacteroides sp.]|uniref:CRISPR-associated protein Cas7 n=1 Tax=uncultured Bacteroides sp. TaxID=162156 RepID=UPI002610EF53|nr:CRISPR-associated protein Cas7 [uncultured Bacteroides sp.]
MNPYIYLRALKHAEHTVFCVEDGQKTYFDSQFNRILAYSSGQQVKRSVLQALTDYMNVPLAPITFNYNISANNELENKEPWSPCDPTYVDQLLGGWMRAKTTSVKSDKKESEQSKENSVLKRRSPLSISAMRPLHPLLAGVEKENITFDRSDRPDYHPVNVRIKGSEKLLTEEEIEEFLNNNNRSLSRRTWIPDNKRTTGLFIYDIAIDLRTLFCVSTNQHEPEVTKETIASLKEKGWIESENVFGKCLVLPKEEREKIIPALADALIDWRITSNQARTFSLMETLAVAISDNANAIASAIRAKLIDDGDKPKAKPIVDENAGAELYVTLPCASYILTETESVIALDNAKKSLIDKMMAFDYEHQI